MVCQPLPPTFEESSTLPRVREKIANRETLADEFHHWNPAGLLAGKFKKGRGFGLFGDLIVGVVGGHSQQCDLRGSRPGYFRISRQPDHGIHRRDVTDVLGSPVLRTSIIACSNTGEQTFRGTDTTVP